MLQEGHVVDNQDNDVRLLALLVDVDAYGELDVIHHEVEGVFESVDQVLDLPSPLNFATRLDVSSSAAHVVLHDHGSLAALQEHEEEKAACVGGSYLLVGGVAHLWNLT